MRYIIAHHGAYAPTAAVHALAAQEMGQRLDRRETFDHFRGNVEKSRRDLMALLHRLHREGRKVAGYAATSKSTTVINYCGITPELLAYISDTTPLKQGKYSPGMHIPICPYEFFQTEYPDYALLFGWNHGEEIMAKEEAFMAAGGKWILYVPEVRIQ